MTPGPIANAVPFTTVRERHDYMFEITKELLDKVHVPRQDGHHKGFCPACASIYIELSLILDEKLPEVE